MKYQDGGKETAAEFAFALFSRWVEEVASRKHTNAYSVQQIFKFLPYQVWEMDETLLTTRVQL